MSDTDMDASLTHLTATSALVSLRRMSSEKPKKKPKKEKTSDVNGGAEKKKKKKKGTETTIGVGQGIRPQMPRHLKFSP